MKIKNQRAFTLIEMVMVIVIMAIVATILGPFLRQPFIAYQALSQRAELVNMLNSTMDQMVRDIASAVPNSVRESGTVMEMMNTRAYGRYRYSDDPTDNTALTPTQADSLFNVLGNLDGAVFANNNANTTRAIVNNVDVANLYAAASGGVLGVITPTNTRVVSTVAGNERNIALRSTADGITLVPFNFDLIGTGSPSKRVYFSDTAVRYVCANGQINRISTYQPQANIGDVLPGGTTNALVVDNVTNCSFTYNNNTATRSGLVTINIQLTMGGQSVRLIQQVQVANAP